MNIEDLEEHINGDFVMDREKLLITLTMHAINNHATLNVVVRNQAKILRRLELLEGTEDEALNTIINEINSERDKILPDFISRVSE